VQSKIMNSQVYNISVKGEIQKEYKKLD